MTHRVRDIRRELLSLKSVCTGSRARECERCDEIAANVVRFTLGEGGLGGIGGGCQR